MYYLIYYMIYCTILYYILAYFNIYQFITLHYTILDLIRLYLIEIVTVDPWHSWCFFRDLFLIYYWRFFLWGGLCRDTCRGEGGRRCWHQIFFRRHSSTSLHPFPRIMARDADCHFVGTVGVFQFQSSHVTRHPGNLTIWKLNLLGWNWIGICCVEPCSQGESSCAETPVGAWAQVCLRWAWEVFAITTTFIYFMF